MTDAETTIKKFKVIPDVPKKLAGLYDIAYNIWLYWTPDAIKLFIRMDPDLWDKTRHNPVKMKRKRHPASPIFRWNMDSAKPCPFIPAGWVYWPEIISSPPAISG